MTDKKTDDVELPGWQQFLLLAGVVVVIGVIVFIGRMVFHTENTEEASYSSCETRFDPTPCPEPDYDAELEETLKQHPDDSY